MESQAPTHGEGGGSPPRPGRFRTLPPDRYRDFRPEGRGGMGIVYWAIDSDLNREVAFKIVRPPVPGSDDAPPQPLGLAPPAADSAAALTFDALRTRLLQEAWVTAAMAHPGIVPVFEVGQTPEGVPYYTMRYVRGKRTLTHAIEEARTAGPEARLALLEPFLKVCDAIAYAHARGIVHRDLKPDNVALGEFGEVVVLDWGLAKMGGTSEVADDRFRALVEAWHGAARERTGAVGMGTLGYMAPEALRAGGEVDARSDVYSLGAILFRALTGRLPHDAETVGEMMEKVVGEDPPSADVLDPAVPSALSVLCGRCLSRDRSRRPADAAAVGRAVRAWQAERAQEHELERVLQAARVATGEAEALRGAAFHAALARVEERLAQALALRPDDAEALRVRGRVEALRTAESRRARRAARNLVAVPLLLVLVGFGTWAYVRERAHAASDLRAAQDRAAETRRHAEETRRNLLRAQVLGLADASAEARARDPMRALLLAREAVKKMLEAGEPIPLATDRLHAALAASAERRRLPSHATPATACGLVPARDAAWAADEHGVRWWSLDERVDVVFPGAVSAVGVSPDGRFLVTASPQGDVAVRAPPESAVLASAHAHDGGVLAVAVAADGTFATASADGTSRVWSPRAEPLARLEVGEPVRSVAFADGGAQVLTVAAGGARLWTRDGAPVAEFPRQGATGAVLGAVASSKGGVVATWEDRTVHVWRITGRMAQVEGPAPLSADEPGPPPFGFSPDGFDLLVALPGELRLLTLGGSPRVVYRHPESGTARATAWAWAPNGDLLAAAPGRLRAWRADGASTASLPAHERNAIVSVAWEIGEHGGPWTVGLDGTARRWSLDGDEAPAPTPEELVPTKPRVVSSTAEVREGRVEVRDAERRVVRTLEETGVVFVGADVGPTTGRVLAWGSRGEVRIFGAGAAPIESWNDPSERVGAMRESPGGEHYLFTTPDGPRVWHPKVGRAPSLQGDAGDLAAVGFAEDGRHVLGSSRETRMLHVWDYDGREEASVRPPAGVTTGRLSPSGDRLFGVGPGGVARAWFLDPVRLLELASERATGGFTRAEQSTYRTLLDEPAAAPSADDATGD